MQAAIQGRGYSLVEMVVVLAIIAMASVGVAGLGGLIHDMQLRSSRDALLSALQRARFEAIRHNARVIICKSASGAACEPAGRWHQGWIVFHDDNQDGQRDAAEALLHRQQALPPSVRVRANTPSMGSYVAFARHGGSRELPTSPGQTEGRLQMGRFTLCSTSAFSMSGIDVVLRHSGRTRVEPSTPAPCH